MAAAAFLKDGTDPPGRSSDNAWQQNLQNRHVRCQDIALSKKAQDELGYKALVDKSGGLMRLAE